MGAKASTTVSEFPLPASHVDGGYGSAPRLPFTGFLVWGLLTFWAYTAIRLAQAWREHSAERWDEFRPVLERGSPDAERLNAFQKRGFAVDAAIPYGAAAAFALSGVVVAVWFVRWILIGSTHDYWEIMTAVGLSSLLFYAGTCGLTSWLARKVEAHELSELLVVESGPAAVDARRKLAAEDLVARWEAFHNRVALFLIVALPMVGSPVLGAHLLMTGVTSEYESWPAALCFLVAVVFHFWGTKLLVGLYNSHLAFETSRRRAMAVPDTTARPAARNIAPPASEATAGATDDLEPYAGTEPFIFVSYKRDDFDRIRPLLRRIRGWGYRIWYDKGIPGGAEWDALIEQKLKGCILLLYFVSRGSVESKYCRREVKYTDQLNKPILSVRLEPAELGHGLEMLLTQYQMIDAGAQDFSSEIERALKYLRIL